MERIIIKNQLEKSLIPGSVIITDANNEPSYQVLSTNSGSMVLPTPRVFIAAQNFFNQPSSSDPNSVLTLDPNAANKPVRIKLYYEGNDSPQSWQNLPDLKYELMRSKAYQTGHSTSLQKGRAGHLWVHPSHLNGSTRTNTIYSSGSQNDHTGTTLPNRETEWTVITTSNKGATQLVGNNPFTELEIDPKLWFYNPSVGLGNNVLPMRHIEYMDNNVRISGHRGHNRYHGVQTFKFCFRMSAADPTSWNPTKNRYDKRLYSDYSEEFELFPHSGVFTYPGSNNLEKIYYEWRVKRL